MNYNLSRYNGSFLDPFFSTFFDNVSNSENFGSLAMKTDIHEDEKSYWMDVELPGIEKSNIDLSLEDGYLTISAKSSTIKKDKEGKNAGFVHRERFSGSATRSYYVGDVREEDISATFKDGILTISFPKEAVNREEPKHTIAIN